MRMPHQTKPHNSKEEPEETKKAHKFIHINQLSGKCVVRLWSRLIFEYDDESRTVTLYVVRRCYCHTTPQPLLINYLNRFTFLCMTLFSLSNISTKKVNKCVHFGRPYVFIWIVRKWMKHLTSCTPFTAIRLMQSWNREAENTARMKKWLEKEWEKTK